MPTAMSSDQIRQLRDAAIPAECDGACTDVICTLDQHGVTLNWKQFVSLLSSGDPGLILKQVKDFLGTFDPKP